MPEQMTSDEYAASYGGSCPYCGSHDIEAVEHLSEEAGQAWHRIECRDCRKAWQDIYHLVGYEPIEG